MSNQIKNLKTARIYKLIYFLFQAQKGLNRLFAARKPKTVQEIRDVTIEAAMERIRPMMMTTMTTIFGLMPVMWATGMGAEVAKPMAIPAIGGMILEVMTMGTVPCLYAWLEEYKLKRKLKALASLEKG